MKKLGFLLGISLLLHCQALLGQSRKDSLHLLGICDADGYCIPKLPGLPKSKGLQLNYRNLLDHSINTNQDNRNYTGRVDDNREFEIKLRLPLILKPKLKLIAGIEYSTQSFHFEDKEQVLHEFYQTIEKKPLRTLGASAYLMRPLMGNRYIISKLNLRLSGDFTKKDLDNYIRVSLSVLYGFRSSPTFTWATGLSYGSSFGRQTIVPLLAFSKKLNTKWSIESILPINIRLRYMLNEKNVFEFKNNVSGDSYNLTMDDQSNYYLQQSNLYTSLIYEREIHDFIWFSVTVGSRYNLGFDLSDHNSFLVRGTPKVENQLASTVYYQASIFLVPPKKWMK